MSDSVAICAIPSCTKHITLLLNKLESICLLQRYISMEEFTKRLRNAVQFKTAQAHPGRRHVVTSLSFSQSALM